MKLKLVEIKPETTGVTTFVFEPEETLTWEAGQYLHYILPHDDPDDRGTERWFTISSAPYEGKPQITTRHATERSSTFKTALFNLQVGETIEADNPEGDFTFDKSAQESVFIAGGIGVTPFHSILKQLEHDGDKPKIHLLYANKDQNIVFKNELEAIKSQNPNFEITYVFSPQHIDKETLPTLVKDFQNQIFYVSGPEPMVDAVNAALKELGVPDEHLKGDWFPGYPQD